MNKFMIIGLALLLLLISVDAIETGQYKYYTYGRDVNLNEFVIDVNGVRDTDFSSDCNITIRKESTGVLLADNNVMLHDSVLLGLYYLPINASNTSLWTAGKYTSIMYCRDYNNFGTENTSFILDKDIVQTIIDTNAIGKGLNTDQNQILYDLNKWVIAPAIDGDSPVISISYPTNNSTVSATLIEFNVTDDSDLNNILVYVNGLISSVFSFSGDCTKVSTVTTCNYYETGLNINVYNDVNIFATDDYNNTGTAYTNFLYSSTRPRTSLGGNATGLDKSISVVPESFSIEYSKGEKITQSFRIKNNTNYDLFLTFTPSEELAGKVFVNADIRLVQANDEKEFTITFLNEGASVSGNLVVSSQYSSVNVPVNLQEKPVNWLPLLLFFGMCFGGYVIFVKK